MPDSTLYNRRTALKTLAFTCGSLALPAIAQDSIRKLGKTIKLGVITDTHIGLLPKAEDRLHAFLTEMNKEKPNALLQLGDFAFPNKKNQPFVDAFNNAHKHVFHTIGNHDIRDYGHTNEDCLKSWGMPAPYYSKEVEGLRIIVLYGNDKGSPTHKGGYPSYVGKEQQAWLETELKAAKTPVLIVCHQPFAGLGSVNNAKEMQQLLSKYKEKIVLCIHGHTHLDTMLTIEGVSYLHINSASYYWVGGKVRYAEYKDPLFCTLTLDPTKGEIIVKGTKTEWKTKTPEELGYFKGDRAKYKNLVVPKISDRIISNKTNSTK